MRLIDRRKQKFHFYYLTKRLFDITVFENTKKVSFNIASEASQVYILSGQKLVKNAKIQMRRFEQFSNNVISLLLRKFGHRRNYRNKTIFHFSSLTCIGLQDEWSNSCWQATLSKSHLNSSQENRFHLANSLGKRNAKMDDY